MSLISKTSPDAGICIIDHADISPLTGDESADLAKCEADIDRGGNLILNALMAIRNGRLYRAEYSSFEDYCETRWGMTRSYAYRLMNHGCVLDNITADDDLSPIGDKLTEAASREIASLPPETQREVIREVKRQEVRPTAKAVREAKQAVQDKAARDPVRQTGKPSAIVKDSIGRDVPNDLRPKHGTSPLLLALARKLSAIIKEADSISQLAGAEHFDISQFQIEASRLKALLKEAVYYTACPHCNGEAQAMKTCSRCRGTGFLPKRMAGMLSKAEMISLGIN